MVMIKTKGKTYGLTKDEFRRYMFNLWKSAQARKQARLDYQKEKGKTA